AGAVRALLRRAVPFGLLVAGFALYYRVDMVMLEWLAAPGDLGRYAAAYRFLDAVIALAAALGGPLFPRLSSVALTAPGEARRLLEAGWRLRARHRRLRVAEPPPRRPPAPRRVRCDAVGGRAVALRRRHRCNARHGVARAPARRRRRNHARGRDLRGGAVGPRLHAQQR